MHKFDEQQLIADLNEMSPERRTAFAAACAERLMPAYVCFWQKTRRGDALVLRSILDRLWSDLQGERMTEVEVRTASESCIPLIPTEDEGSWVTEQAGAEDAAAALAYALRCRKTSNPKDAAWAGRRVYEALDHYVINREGISLAAEGDEVRVLSHPLIQAELSRQLRDRNELRDGLVTMSRLRERAAEESKFLLRGPGG